MSSEAVIKVGDYTIHRLLPEHAPGVSRLVEKVYGKSYYPPDLYDPQQILQLNQAERLVSVVALDAVAEVVGHYALERPRPSAVAEASDAMVDPAHRHHHLMEEMRQFLRGEAIRLGLAGLVGYAVTNHLFTQKADEHIGAHPCGVALGLWPQSFHNMPEDLKQRMSFVLYFRYLRPPDRTVQVVTHHQGMLERIAQQFAIAIEPIAPAAAPAAGEVEVEYEAPVTSGTIRVRRVGADSLAAILKARQEFAEQAGARAFTLELPLAQGGTADLCRQVEQHGFFFCGVGPAFLPDGDALLLQWVAEPIDPGLVQIENPFAKEMLDYAAAERRRVETLVQ